MKCSKCEKELDMNSRFCSNCGTEVKEKPNHLRFEDVVKTASKVWFVLGYVKGCDKDNKDSLSEFEKVLKNNHEDLWELYKEVIEHWQNWAKESNNEKDKETNGSKRTCVSETKRNKTK